MDRGTLGMAAKKMQGVGNCDFSKNSTATYILVCCLSPPPEYFGVFP